jgi:4-hydroxy-3-methylbut-2-enyl diphosphate reductase
VDEAQRVIAELKQKYPRIESPPKQDICYATTNRQDAVKQLAQRADAVIVLGSQNSSHSRRLRELGESFGKPAVLIDAAEELRTEWFHSMEMECHNSDQTVAPSRASPALRRHPC